MAFEQSVLVFGDSLSASYNIATENGWVTLLEQKLRSSDKSVKFVNASISGETSSGGLVRFEQQVNKTKPTVVILELGANDGLRGFNLTTTRNNLTQMIEISEAQGAKVLLAGIHIPPNYGRTYTRKFDQIFTDLAKREQVSLIPFILEGVATLPALMQNDGLHPNEKGQLVIVDTVHKYLLPML
ncbi:MAG: arylesterase [Kangiellaceae bacterium]|nr:arylesterase [Kangiellaceae bacterium]